MFKNLKINSKDYDGIFFGSDFHLDHKKPWIVEHRGYKNSDEHNECTIKSVNSLCSKNSLLIYLGDFSLNSSVERTKNFLNRLNPKIFYIFGNHCSNIRQIYKEALLEFTTRDIEIYPLTWENVTFLGNDQFFYIDKKGVYCKHMACSIWPEQNHFSYCLVGHSHGNYPNILPEYKYGKILDCGIDVAMKYSGNAIFSWEEVQKIMSEKQVLKLDHH